MLSRDSSILNSICSRISNSMTDGMAVLNELSSRAADIDESSSAEAEGYDPTDSLFVCGESKCGRDHDHHFNQYCR